MHLIDKKNHNDGTTSIVYSEGSSIIALLFRGKYFVLGKITSIQVKIGNSGNTTVSIGKEDLEMFQEAIQKAAAETM